MTKMIKNKLFRPAVDCGMPPSTANGQVTASSTTLDSVATYQCDLGFSFTSGEMEVTRMCQSDGTWSDMSSMCERELHSALFCIVQHIS